MSDYTKDEILTMQEDALRRVREMQRRASQNIRATNASQRNPGPNRRRPPNANSGQNKPMHMEQAKKPPPEAIDTAKEAKISPAQNTPNAGPLSNIIKSLNLDSETVVLLVLLFILIKEEADQSLIFSLVYLLI